MDRKSFLIGGVSLLGAAAVLPRVLATAPKDGNPLAKDGCDTSPMETEGPFPTINPSNFEQVNIVGNRTGVDFEINIKILNTDNDCNPLVGAYVDIWHCDKDGYYSQYGGIPMQTVDYTSENFLRGRQVTNASGDVSFVSIFPGWYTSRATHIHVHIYGPSGNSLLVTQISFPEGSGSAVELVNSATAYGYTKGMSGYTYNAQDNVFSDDTTNSEMCSLSGSVDDGYVLTHEIRVEAGATASVDENELNPSNFSNIYPTPIEAVGHLDVTLKETSQVKLKIFDLKGKLMAISFDDTVYQGTSTISFERGILQTGIYLYTIVVESSSGTFEKSGKLMFK